MVIGQAEVQKPGGKEGARKGPQVGMGAWRDLGAELRAQGRLQESDGPGEALLRGHPRPIPVETRRVPVRGAGEAGQRQLRGLSLGSQQAAGVAAGRLGNWLF